MKRENILPGLPVQNKAMGVKFCCRKTGSVDERVKLSWKKSFAGRGYVA